MSSRRYSLWELILSDIAVWGELWSPPHDGRGTRYGLLTSGGLVLSHLGLRAAIIYRLAHEAHRRGIRGLPLSLYQMNVTLHGIDIPASVEIGPRLYIPHPVGTVVAAERIGSGITLVSNVTIGMRNEHAFPVIGDNVYIGAGARVLGGIRVGNDVLIGANAVVLEDVRDDSVAVGVPATVRPRATGRAAVGLRG